MKKGILFFMLLLHIEATNAQLLVQYRECITCDTHTQNDAGVTYQYGAVSEYEAIKVADDYGVRLEGDKWHGGIDYNSQEDGEVGAGDRGDLIIAIEGGTIGGQLSAGYKRLFVNGEHNFGYGHLFWGTQNNTQSGGCFLRELEFPNLNNWAIILVVDGDTIAIGPDAGQVLFGVDTLAVQTTIEAGDPIGPTGGSSTGSELGPHLHLYSNPAGSTSVNDEINMNPLQYVQYADTTFEVKILKQNDTDEGITLIYPGTGTTTIQVRPKLAGQPTAVNRYPKILDLDQVEIFLKRSDSSTYERIKGPNFESNLCLGGRIGGPERYPRKADAPGNSNSPWYNTATQWNRTGIHPYAYRGSGIANPWDDFYFADFATRVHKDDSLGSVATTGPHKYADFPNDARYNDGKYLIKAHVVNVVGDVQEGPKDTSGVLAPVEIILDNFKPFVSNVKVMVGTDTIYQRQWNGKDNNLNQVGNGCMELGALSKKPTSDMNGSLNVEAHASEPLLFLKAVISTITPDTVVGVATDSSNMVWNFDFGSNLGLQDSVCHTIVYVGKDYNNNTLLDMKAMAGGNQDNACVKIPARQNSNNQPNSWLPLAGNTGKDNVHEFCIELTCTNDLTGGNGQSRSSTDCLDASDIEITLKSEESPGQSDGAIYVDISGGTAPFLFTWKDEAGNIISTSTTNPNLIDVPAGLYCFEFEDETCCKVYGCRTVRECTEIIDYIMQSGTCGEDNGSLVVIVDGENTTPPYSFVWDNGGTTQILTGLSVGEYCVTVTDGGGCTDTECVSLNETFTIEAEITDACEIDGGAIALTINGDPGANYYFAWDHDEYTQNIENLQAGTYSVTVTDSGGCTGEESFDIEDNVDPEFAIELESIECICPGLFGGIDITVTGDSGPYTYIWTGPNGEFSNEEDFNNITLSGVYSVEVVNALGCIVSESITIDYCDFDFTNFTTNINHSCNGPNTGSIEVQVSPPNAASAPFQYILEDVNNNFILTDGSLDGDILIDGLGAEEYCLTVLSANGCETTSNCGLIIELMSPPNIDWIVTPATDLTSGDGAIDLTVDGNFGPYTYSWTPGGATTEDINGLNPGSYTVDIVDAQGDCTYSATIQVEQCVDLENNITISAEVTPMTGDMDDGAIDITLENGDGYQFTYLWSNGATTEDLSGLSEGNYCVTVTHSECSGFEISDCFEICGFGLDLGFESYENCIGTTVNTYISGGVGPFTYQWSPIGSSSPNPFLPYGENCVEITDGNGCQTTKCITIEIPELELTLDVTNATMGITNGSVSTNVQSGFPPYTYLWDNGSTNPDILYLMPGKYCVTVTDFCGSTVSECAKVECEIDSRHVGAEITDYSCNTGELGAIDMEVLFFIPNNLNNTFTWSNGATTDDISGLYAGEYCVTIVDGWTSCEYSDCFTVGASGTGNFNISFEYDNPCHGGDDGSITAIPVGGEAPFTYFWQHWGEPPITGNEQTLSDIPAGWYGVTVTDALGCSASNFTLMWPSAPNFDVEIELNPDKVLCPGETTTAIATVLGGEPPYIYTWAEWLGGSLQTIVDPNPSLVNTIGSLDGGTYFLTVTDDEGCMRVKHFVIQESSIMNINAQVEDVCNFVKGSITLNVSGGRPPYSFQWDNGSTSQNISNLNQGDYCVTITDVVGCTREDCFTVLQRYLSVLSTDITDSECGSLCDGSIDIHVNSSHPVAYSWSNGATTQDIYDLCSGIYTVTMTSGSCVKIQNFVVQGEDENFEYEVEVIRHLNYRNYPSNYPAGDGIVKICSDVFTTIFNFNGFYLEETNTYHHVANGCVTVNIPETYDYVTTFHFNYTAPNGCVYEGTFDGIPFCTYPEDGFGFLVTHIGDEQGACGVGQQHTYKVTVYNVGNNPPYFIDVTMEAASSQLELEYLQTVEFPGDPNTPLPFEFFIYNVPAGDVLFQSYNRCGIDWTLNPNIPETPSFGADRHTNCCYGFSCDLFSESHSESQGGSHTYDYPYFRLEVESECFDGNCGTIFPQLCSKVKINLNTVAPEYNCWTGTVTIGYPGGSSAVFQVIENSPGYDQIQWLAGNDEWKPPSPGTYLINFSFLGNGASSGENCQTQLEIDFYGGSNYQNAIVFRDDYWFPDTYYPDGSMDAYFGASSCQMCSDANNPYLFNRHQCDEEYNYNFTYFNFEPIDYNNSPCMSGGVLTIMKFDENGEATIQTVIIPPNTALAEFPDLQPFDGPDDQWCSNSGWCHFSGLTVYGFPLPKPILATWYEPETCDDIDDPGIPPCNDITNPCIFGQCINGDCIVFGDDCFPSCPPGYFCVEGECVIQDGGLPCLGNCNCPEGQFCLNGYCVPLPGGLECAGDCQCPENYSCLNGYCSLVGCTPSCPPNQYCKNNSCIECPTVTIDYCYGDGGCGDATDCILVISLSSSHTILTNFVVLKDGISVYSENIQLTTNPKVRHIVVPQLCEGGFLYSASVTHDECGVLKSTSFGLLACTTGCFGGGPGNDSYSSNAPTTSNSAEQGVKMEEVIKSTLSTDFKEKKVSTNKYFLYPNPFSDIINVECRTEEPGTMDIVISNVYGSLIQKESYIVFPGSNEVQVKLTSDLPPGVYFVLITNEKGESEIFKLLHADL